MKNRKINIVTVIGARPQFIKASLLSKKFHLDDDINEVIIHTGQHFEYLMSDKFFLELNLPTPKYNLNVNSLSHGSMTGMMLKKIEGILIKENPDYVLVYGDTNSTLAGALSAVKLKIPVIHIEAGLRSYNMNMPEEINRIITDRISKYLFCPTKTALSNLKKEGFRSNNYEVFFSGDVMYDTILYYKKYAVKPKLDLDNNFIIATVHREENTNNIENFISIINSLIEISNEIQVILPLHPKSKKIFLSNKFLKDKFKKSKILFTKPLGYLEMLYCLSNCIMVITDSGGLQKESFFMSKPCIIIRNETEWIELVKYDYNYLAGTDQNKILYYYEVIKEKKFIYNKNFFGNGNAVEIIFSKIKEIS